MIFFNCTKALKGEVALLATMS